MIRDNANIENTDIPNIESTLLYIDTIMITLSKMGFEDGFEMGFRMVLIYKRVRIEYGFLFLKMVKPDFRISLEFFKKIC